MNITGDIKYIGVHDSKIDLFESQYRVPNGVSYNSYIIIDDAIAVMDTVDEKFGDEWLGNLKTALDGREPDYLIVQHMEPDHSANIERFAKTYSCAKIVASAKAFAMMKNFFGTDFSDRKIEVSEGSKLSLGKHELSFITAPMVHWPEVIMAYDSLQKVLFSADGFGRFGIFDESEPWDDEARRYYIGIVGKYGAQVQSLLKKAASLDIQIICSLHGPVLTKNLDRYIRLYDLWSSYSPEENGVVIAYASIYGNTAKAANLLADELRKYGQNVKVHDLSRCDMHEAIADAFRYDRLVLASSTYNGGVFPPMHAYIHGLAERGYRSRMVAFIENGSWAPMASKTMKSMLEECKELKLVSSEVKILSAVNCATEAQISALAKELSIKN